MTELTAPESKDEEVLFEGNPALFPTITSLLLAILTVGLAALYFLIRQKTLHYRITSERIVVESGLFSKHMEQIDIYRINDYTVERPFSQRIMGNGNIVISAMDRTTPRVELHALRTDVVALYEKLRKATEREKHRRGVRMVDYE